MVDLGNILEPVAVQTILVDGAATISIDRNGTARLVLYSEQLEVDGSLSPVVAARLTMTHSVMVEIGQAMMMSFAGMDPAIRVDNRRRLKMI